MVYTLGMEALKCLGMSGEDLIYLVDAVAEQLAETKELFNLCRKWAGCHME